MFHKGLFVITILTLVAIGIVFARLSQTNETTKHYRRYGFIQSDIHYEKVEKSWGEQGLIFYQLEFPGLNVQHHIDKMTLSMNDSGIKAHLSHVRLNVKQGMKNLYASQPAQALNDYVPYQDFFNRLLTSLSVMGVDEFVGDILINTTYSDLKTMHFSTQVNQENKPTLTITGIIHIPVVGGHKVSDLWTGSLTDLDIHVQDKIKLQRYINYAKSRKIQIPEGLKNGFISFKGLSLKLPRLPNLMR